MSSAYQYYMFTLLVYFGVNTIAAWALNLQYGISGVLNFAFIMFQSMGAYTAAVVTLGPSRTSCRSDCRSSTRRSQRSSPTKPFPASSPRMFDVNGW